jgi:ABC-type amino acid transport substrate-binding protein
MRALFSRTRDALIVAFVAGDLFIVLPSLINACKDLLEHRHEGGHGAEELRAGPEVIVPVSFNFPHTGKLLSLSFIPFAAWFADASLSIRDYLQLFGAGVLSFFGSLNSAVPFLLDLFHLPADTFQLFLATGVINSRFGTLVAAMHTVTVAILGSLALAGGVQWRVRPLVRFAVVTGLLLLATLGGLRVLFGTVLRQEFAGADMVYGMQPLLAGPAVDLTPAPPADTPDGTSQGPVLEAIRSRGILRVVVLPDRMPFAFQNRQNQLVGLDVEMAQALAADLGVKAAFFEAEYEELSSLLGNGRCDIAMSGVAITPERATDLLFSAPYLDETLAFVARDHLRDRFMSWDAIRALGTIRVGVPDLPAYKRAVSSRAPQVEIVPLRKPGEIFARDDEVMAYVLPAERGSVLTLLNPAYSVVVPKPDTIKLPVAYPLARGDERWATFINTWLELKRRDGTIDALYRHWILGQEAARSSPRWSVIRNVFHWVE